MTENPPQSASQLEPPAPVLAQALAHMWAGRRFLLAVFVLCTGLALAATWLLPTRYASDATVLVVSQSQRGRTGLADLLAGLPLELDSGGTGLEISTPEREGTVLAFLESRRLAEMLLGRYGLLNEVYATPVDTAVDAVRQVLGLPVERNVARAIQDERLDAIYDVDAQGRGRRVTIRLRAGTPRRAQTACAAVLTELQNYLANDHETTAGRERRFLQGQLDAARAGLARWEDARPGPEQSLGRIQREIAAAARLVSDLQRRLASARAAEAKEEVGIKVLDEPFVPAKPAGPGTKLKFALACVFGAFAALALLFARVVWAELRPLVRRQAAES